MADTIPGNTTSTQPLAIGVSTVGVVDAAWDNDWFRVTLTKGVAYKFELKGVDGGGGTLTDPWLKLFSDKGILLGTDDDGTAVYDNLASHSHDSQLVFIPQESGNYFIDATGFAGVVGTYTLSATTLASDYYIQSVLAQPNIRWNGGQSLGTPVNVTYCFPTTQPTDFGNSQTVGFGALSVTQQAIVRAALGEIETIVNIHFQEMPGGSGSIRFATSNQGTDSNGVTYRAGTSTTYTQADVALNNASSGISDWSPGSYMYKTLVHEIGHALGLKHPGNYNGVSGTADLPYLPSSQDASPYTIESYNNSTSYLGFTANGYLYAKTMMGFDIAALQYLYGKNTSTHTGSDTYAFDSKALYSIWDAGGVDTLNGSTATTSVTLDLGQGQISYTGLVGTDTIGRGLAPGFSIAFGTDIENATGGAYADLLIGNSLSNAISGGGGDDQILGYAGDDSLSGGSGNDTISGDAGNDHVDGGDGADTLYGGDGNDIFDWDGSARGGIDTFYGGSGNDTYVLSQFDSVIEYADQGTDTVWVSFSYSIANLTNIENLYAFGLTGVTLTGNAANNTLDGTSSNDIIDGGAGTDTVSYGGASTNYLITTTAGGFTIASATDGTDTLRNVEFAAFADRTITLAYGDTAAPTVSTFSPIDEATGIAIGSNITLTFSETIQRGTGNIVLKSSSGIVVATYDAATSTNLSISGGTLTINPTVDLVGSTGYKVEFATGTIKDLAGNSYAGTTSYNFTTIAAPTQTVTGTSASESFTSGLGNDTIDGGAGVDAVVYSGSRANFSLTKTSTGFTVVDSTGAAGTDTLQNVERIKFSDGAIALDVGATQPAGQTAMLLGAVLPGRLAFDASKQALLGAAIDLFDQGYSLQTLSGAVMRLPIWDVLTGKAAPTSTDIATYLLTNVNGAAPDTTTLANAVTALNAEVDFASQGIFLWHLAESAANQTHVGLVGLASTGLTFTI